MNSTREKERPDALRRIATIITVPLGALASLSTIAIMVVITIDVVVRNVGGRSVPGLLEMSESALVATVFLGLAYAGATNSHVAVDLLTNALPRRAARILIGVGWLIGIVVTVWFVIATSERALQSTEAGELRQGLIDWPLWPARWLVVIGFASFLLVAIINVVLVLRGKPLLGEDSVDPDLVAAREARSHRKGGSSAADPADDEVGGPERPADGPHTEESR
ncbi:TRAP transporter small permease [Microbacterium sp. G2-8]|uniref:TRAP transporter small permease n=1 Tax=Microbacterium sp. G2-8 TaxID=2842454 RepID=UPI001C8939E8|nr:TRAP transporter small permease [Microbacterium sp. G2-8]